MSSVLIVANDFPFPPNHGASADMWERLLVFKGLGIQVDLLASVREMPDEDALRTVRDQVRNMWIVPRRRGLGSFLSLTPFQVRSRADLKNANTRSDYDAVVLEAEHVGAFLQNPAAQHTRLILRIHNDEARYFRELAMGSGPLWKKIFYAVESFKFRAFSPYVQRTCDALWFISDFERREYLRVHSEDAKKAIFLPPHVRIDSMRPFCAKNETALFVGTLTIPHNADAISWYISEIHPLLSESEGYSFVVAGRAGGNPITDLKVRIQGCGNIALIEDPIELGEIYEQSGVFVNPVRRGAGVKLKIIHALAAGLPVVSTSAGVEGTGLEHNRHILIADSSAQFASCVRELLGNRRKAEFLVRNAQEFLAAKYDTRTNLERAMPEVFCPSAE